MHGEHIALHIQTERITLDARQVQLLCIGITGFGNDLQSGDDEACTSGKIDEKNPTPAEEVGDGAAQDRSGGECDAEAGTPEGKGAGPLDPCEVVRDDGEGCGQQQRAADALCGAG